MRIAATFVAVAVGILGLSGTSLHSQSSTRSHPVALFVTPAGDPGHSSSSADDGAIVLAGRVQARTKVCISSLLSLPVVELPVKEGDRVYKADAQGARSSGSILAKLDDTDLKAALRAAEAKRNAAIGEIEAARVRLVAQESQVASCRVSLGEAERNRKRVDQLDAQSLTSQASADEAHCKFDRLKADHEAAMHTYEAGQAAMKVLRQNLGAAEAEVEHARLMLATATITSPIDGVVTHLNVAVGEIVTSAAQSPSTILMEVADMDHLVLVAAVSEEAIGKVRVGQKARVHLKGCGRQSFTGAVENVAMTSTEEKDGTRYIKATIGLDTAGRTIPAGLSGEAEISYAPAH